MRIRGASVVAMLGGTASAALVAGTAVAAGNAYGDVRLATSIVTTDRATKGADEFVSYTMRVRAIGGMAYGTRVKVAMRPAARWSAHPASCHVTERRAQLTCELGDVPATTDLRFTARIPATTVPTLVTVTGAANATEESVATSAIVTSPSTGVSATVSPSESSTATPSPQPTPEVTPTPTPTLTPSEPPTESASASSSIESATAKRKDKPRTAKSASSPRTRKSAAASRPTKRKTKKRTYYRPVPVAPPAAQAAPQPAPAPIAPPAPAPPPAPPPAAPAPPPAAAPAPAPVPSLQSPPEPMATLGVPDLPDVQPSASPTAAPATPVLPTLEAMSPSVAPPQAQAGGEHSTVDPPQLSMMRAEPVAGTRRAWVTVLAVTIVFEVAVLWIAACLSLWRNRTALARTVGGGKSARSAPRALWTAATRWLGVRRRRRP